MPAVQDIRLKLKVGICILLGLCLTNPLLALASQAKSERFSFKSYKMLCQANKAEYYLKEWGKPDFFLLSIMSLRAGRGAVRRQELWVYTGAGVQVLFENGVGVKEFLFKPNDSRYLPAAPTDLSPQDFSEQTSLADIRKRFGKPETESEKTVSDLKLQTLSYQNAGYKSFAFINGKLAFVSAGLPANSKNPWSLNTHESLVPDNPSALNGNWDSNLGKLEIKPSSINPKYFEGKFHPKTYLKGTPAKDQLGIIADGVMDLKSKRVHFSIHNWGANGEFVISPDGKTMIGGLFIKKEYHRWRLNAVD